MNCSQVNKLKEAYVDNRLSANARVALEVHTSGCALCTRRIGVAQQVKSGMSKAVKLALGDLTPTASDMAAMRARLDARISSNGASRFRMPSYSLSIPLMMLLVATILATAIQTGFVHRLLNPDVTIRPVPVFSTPSPTVAWVAPSSTATPLVQATDEARPRPTDEAVLPQVIDTPEPTKAADDVVVPTAEATSLPPRGPRPEATAQKSESSPTEKPGNAALPTATAAIAVIGPDEPVVLPTVTEELATEQVTPEARPFAPVATSTRAQERATEEASSTSTSVPTRQVATETRTPISGQAATATATLKPTEEAEPREVTSTPTRTRTATLVPSTTATETPTSAPATSTNVPVAATRTATPSQTASAVPTQTATQTNTALPTSTLIPTATSSVVPSSTATQTSVAPSATATRTPTMPPPPHHSPTPPPQWTPPPTRTSAPQPTGPPPPPHGTPSPFPTHGPEGTHQPHETSPPPPPHP